MFLGRPIERRPSAGISPEELAHVAGKKETWVSAKAAAPTIWSWIKQKIFTLNEKFQEEKTEVERQKRLRNYHTGSTGIIVIFPGSELLVFNRDKC